MEHTGFCRAWWIQLVRRKEGETAEDRQTWSFVQYVGLPRAGFPLYIALGLHDLSPCLQLGRALMAVLCVSWPL